MPSRQHEETLKYVSQSGSGIQCPDHSLVTKVVLRRSPLHSRSYFNYFKHFYHYMVLWYYCE